MNKLNQLNKLNKQNIIKSALVGMFFGLLFLAMISIWRTAEIKEVKAELEQYKSMENSCPAPTTYYKDNSC